MANIATSYSNIRKGAWKNVRASLLSNITGVGTRVYGAYPKSNVTLPLIVIENPIKGTDEETKTLEYDNMRSVLINISIYTKQAEQLDSILDEIEAQIESDRTIYASYGLNMTDDILTDVDDGVFMDLQKQRSHVKTSSVTFEVDR